MPVIGNGVEICTSTTRPTTGVVVGTMIYETDTASYRWCSQISPSIVWIGMIPVGTVQPFAGTTAPVGWLLCAGQTLNASTNPEYADLWAVLGTTYGGTGITSFTLPDLRGRAPFGRDNMNGTTASRITSTSGITGTTLGAAGGDQRLQGHTHTYSGTSGADSPDHGHLAGEVGYINVGAGGWPAIAAYQNVRGTSGRASTHSHSYSGTTDGHNQTSGGASQNMPPTIILNYIIKF